MLGVKTNISRNVTYLPETYIVELEPANESTSPSSRFANIHGGSIRCQIRNEFGNSKYFYGLSLTVTDGSTMSDILTTDGVKNVWPVRLVPRPGPPQFSTTASPMSPPGNDQVPHITGTSDVNRPLKMAGVDKLHNMGIKGKGIKIALIDTGVDYLHPSLGGGFGPGFKISFGYDFVGDNYTGGNAPMPGPDPLATCAGGGHGSHTTGIVGMTDRPNEGFGLVGVAPEASLGMYRVFGCSGAAPDDIILSAMHRAAEDGADIISMSLGDLAGWEAGSPYVPLVQNIVDSGIAVIAALGNEGQTGPYEVSAPGLAPAALGVGAVENEIYPTVYRAQSNIGGTLDYVSVLPLEGRYTLYRVGTGVTTPLTDFQTDGCDPDDWTTAAIAVTDGANTVALLQYAPTLCSFAVYADNLLALNITTVILYTNDPDTPVLLADPGSVDPFRLLFLTYTESQKLLKVLSGLLSSEQYTLSFGSNDDNVFDAPNPAHSSVDYFSSIGPTMELTLKPQLSAPGGNILATFPRSVGGYAVLSGTSMSTPFTAGVYALLKSQHPDWSVAEITSLLQSTAVPLTAQNADILSSVAQQGAGLINAYKAVMADSQISPSQLSLRDSSKPAKQTVTVKNTSKKTKTYHISHTGASYIRTLTNFTGSDYFALQTFTLTHEAKYATAKFSKTQFTLRPGQSTTVQVQITPAEESSPQSEPIYSGFINIDTDGSSYVVPYLGVPYNIHDANYFHYNTTLWVGNQEPCTAPGSNAPCDVNIGNYTVYYENGTVPDAPLIPFIEFAVVQPSSFVRLDAVPVNTTFEPTYYGFDPSVKINVPDIDLPILPGYLDVPYYGLLVEWGFGNLPPGVNPNALAHAVPRPNLISGIVLLFPTFSFENGSLFSAPPGAFRPLLRVLKYGSSGTSADDYLSWLGPICNLLPPSG
ncbi:peptidase S8/S53 domain-containing protein [Xylogone sp. PMI_703]|nr:peptidase S8/S53 domain-containing protein [Xylogone sp. PMI_703]